MEVTDTEKLQDPIIGNYIRDLPGSDISRTIVFTFVVLLILAVPNICGIGIQNVEKTALSDYATFNTLILVLTLVLLSYSSFLAFNINRSRRSEIRITDVFLPRILISVSAILFFVNICFWIIVLGGIRISPFTSFLTISPVVMMIQMFHDRKESHEAVLEFFTNTNETSEDYASLRMQLNRAMRLTCVLNHIPLIIVLIMITIGEIALNYQTSNGYKSFLGLIIYSPDKSVFLDRLKYVMFYLSLSVAILGVMPDVTRSLSKKILRINP